MFNLSDDDKVAVKEQLLGDRYKGLNSVTKCRQAILLHLLVEKKSVRDILEMTEESDETVQEIFRSL